MSHLYKKFVGEQIGDLIGKTEGIRTCTVIAHIDHGKTTLTDSLIAASGLLSKEVAATARLLDYDLIEQERGITIKAAGISLVHRSNDGDYLIHLIDTPGHIDFSSHVTRGLRLTDGAIIVIDVIEGLMVQTETVTRQAMKELVKPILFVNKVDRLINEKRLGPQKIAEEISKVVREFNAMLGKYLDDDLLEEWEVSFNRSSLYVGSAKDKWAIGFEDLLSYSGNLEDTSSLAKAFVHLMEGITKSYHEENERTLSERYPLAEKVLGGVVKSIPNPIKAQEYRIPTFWDGNLSSDIGKSLTTCDSEGEIVLLVGDVQSDRHAGQVAAVRVFSGTLHRAKPMLNLRTKKEGKTLQIGLFMSKTRVAHDPIPAGNLAFISGIRGLTTGDTLVNSNLSDMIPLRGLQYPMEPVVTYTIEPKKLSDLDETQCAIAEFVETDPALEFDVNTETGEMLISGAGELHVEISVEKLERTGTRVILGKPMVLLKEEMLEDGISVQGGTDSTSRFTLRAVITPNDLSSLGTIIQSKPSSECFLVDSTGRIKPYSDEIEWIEEAFDVVTRNGPVNGERLRKVTIVLEETEIQFESPETSWRDITQPLVTAMRESIKSGNPEILEPWIRLEISTPEEHVGVISSVLARRKGDILEIDSERSLFRIVAEIPVRESFGFANEIRTETSGWATWGAKPAGYRKLKHKKEPEEY